MLLHVAFTRCFARAIAARWFAGYRVLLLRCPMHRCAACRAMTAWHVVRRQEVNASNECRVLQCVMSRVCAIPLARLWRRLAYLAQRGSFQQGYGPKNEESHRPAPLTSCLPRCGGWAGGGVGWGRGGWGWVGGWGVVGGGVGWGGPGHAAEEKRVSHSRAAAQPSDALPARPLHGPENRNSDCATWHHRAKETARAAQLRKDGDSNLTQECRSCALGRSLLAGDWLPASSSCWKSGNHTPKPPCDGLLLRYLHECAAINIQAVASALQACRLAMFQGKSTKSTVEPGTQMSGMAPAACEPANRF